jgi:hypothetical protein
MFAGQSSRAIRYDREVTPLVRSGAPHDDSLETLHARVSELQHALGARAAGVARAQADLEAFRIRYRREVGTLHEELEELERAVAEAELGELSRLVEGQSAAPPPEPRPEPAARFTSDAVRRLFRDVARTVHPDLAGDEQTRDRRHALMVEANRAYAIGDEERLRWILEAWERSPEAVQGSDPGATRQRLVRRIAQIEEQLETYASELAAMRETPLGKLKAMVDEASTRGKDLVSDMVVRLKRDIVATRNRLDAMRWNP